MPGHNSTTALLLMDFQDAVLEMFDPADALANAALAAVAARRWGAPVIWTKIGFRPGAPEIDPANQLFAPLRGAASFEGEGSVIAAGAGLQPDDLVIDKKRASAFAGNDLRLILGAAGVRTLVLAGVFTSGVVLATLAAAADLDFRLVVLGDACGDPDTEIHEALLTRVFPRQAEVMATRSWCDLMDST